MQILEACKLPVAEIFKPVSIKNFVVYECEISSRSGVSQKCPSRSIMKLGALIHVYWDRFKPNSSLIYLNEAFKYYSKCNCF